MELLFYLFVSLFAGINSAIILRNNIPEENFTPYSLALEAVYGMGIRLHAILNINEEENFIVSPISATTLIAQLMLGAEGEFRDQLYDLLSLPKGYPSQFSQLHSYHKNKSNKTYSLPYADFHLQLRALITDLQNKKFGEEFVLKQNNALFYNNNIQLKEKFSKLLNLMYGTEIIPLDFYQDTRSIINKWASDNTNGLIREVVNRPINPSTASLFFNSIYFKANWETPFDGELFNKVDLFYTKKNTNVTTTFMRGMVENVLYKKTKDYTLICLPYKNEELGMYILLPSDDSPYKYNMKEFSKNLNIRLLMENIKLAKSHRVMVKIPKVSLSHTLKILEPLQKYAEYRKHVKVEPRISEDIIKELSNRVATYNNYKTQQKGDILLTNAAEQVDLKISDIVQQIVFSVDEEGTEAAAITGGITDYIGGAKTVLLERPFSFFIQHKATLATIFWGSVSDPTLN